MPGLRDMVLAALSFSLMGVCVKQLRFAMGADQIVFVRSALVLGCILAVAPGGVRAIRGNRPVLLLVRGLLGYTALVLITTAIGLMPYADVVALVSTNPVFAAIAAGLLMGERLSKRVMVALALALGGALLILRPGFEFDLEAGSIALIAAVFSGTAYACVRALSKSERQITIVLYFPLVSLPLSGLRMLDDYVWPSVSQWLLLVLVAATALGGQVFVTRALTVQKAAIATTSTFLGLIFAALWGFVFFAEVPSPWVAAGAGCIALGVWWMR